MRKKLLPVLLLLFVTSINAQIEFKVDPKAGGNTSYTRGDKMSNDVLFGFQGGIGVKAHLEKSFVLMSGLTANVKKTSNTWTVADAKRKIETTATYLTVPLHVGYRFYEGGGLFITPHAGGYLAYGVGGKSKDNLATGTMLNEKPTFGKGNPYKAFDTGLGFGVEMEFKKAVIDIFYDLGLHNISQTSGQKIYNTTFGLSAGYRF